MRKAGSNMVLMPDPSSLKLWKQGLVRVPDFVWERIELRTLILAENRLKEVSEQIGLLKNLRTLDLGHNQLINVPQSLGDLEGLTDFLYLHVNRLTSLPLSMGRLTRLRYLNMSENAFRALPECICRMTGLIELRTSDNQLATLPDSICQLSRLRELHLRNNQLTSLPRSIGELTELRHLDLRSNPLADLPAGIAYLPKLEKLDLRWVDTFGHQIGWLSSRSGVVWSIDDHGFAPTQENRVQTLIRKDLSEFDSIQGA